MIWFRGRVLGTGWTEVVAPIAAYGIGIYGISGGVARRASRDRSIATIDSCRHRATT
jgi:hypothetical protein